MADASFVKQLIEAGIHFGHRTSGWHPKMSPYIYGKRNGIHIVDVRETIKGLLLAKRLVERSVASGKDILFVGTKRQARPSIERVCNEHEMPYVIERWLGGTLTNFRTIRARLKRLEELEQLMESEEWQNYSKKMASQLSREQKKIHRNLAGVRNMNKLPGAVVVVDVRREYNALKEAKKLGIPTICLIDTDSDPAMADVPIPGNDDAMRAIDLVISELGKAVAEGKTARTQQREGADEQAGEDKPKKRSSKAQFRAEETADDSVEPLQQPDSEAMANAPGVAEAGSGIASSHTQSDATAQDTDKPAEDSATQDSSQPDNETSKAST